MRYPNQNRMAFDDSSRAALTSDSTRTFMQRVYWWMFVGLGLTGAISFFIGSSPELSAAVRPFLMPAIVLELVVVLAFSFLQSKVRGVTAAILFLLYAALNGVTLSVIFLAFKLGTVASALAVTAGAFFALSVFATVTKRNLSAWGTFLFIGLVGVMIASIVNIFLASGMLAFITSAAAVVVFAGLTAYDTQKLRRFHAEHGEVAGGSLAISGALMLYLDFINLFLNLLWLFGGDRRR